MILMNNNFLNSIFLRFIMMHYILFTGFRLSIMVGSKLDEY